MENRKIIKKSANEVKFPNSITIGDPSYFEEFKGSNRLKKLVYDKSFRGKSDWIGYVKVSEYNNKSTFHGKEFNFNTCEIDIFFAPNKELLELFKENKCYKNHREKIIEIGVDTAEYIISMGNAMSTISIGSDGFMGSVSEIYNGKKLEGILIELNAGNVISFDTLVSEVEFLFNVKLDKVELR